MQKQLEFIHNWIFARKTTILISASALAVAYLAWDENTRWMRLFKPISIYTRIQGVSSHHAASNSTEDYNYELLRFIYKLNSNYRCKETAKCTEVTFDKVETSEKEADYCELSTKWEYQLLNVPIFGGTNFRYKGGLFYLGRYCDGDLDLYTFIWNRGLMDEFLTEVLEKYKKSHDGNLTAFYHLTSSQEWDRLGYAKRKRPLDSVILQENVKEDILKDVNEFIGNQKWYFEKGVPYRRGYLLHGPPGTGKTSLICALAGEIGFDICILSLSSHFLTDDDLVVAMGKASSKKIILIEDIDAAFKTREFGDDGTEISSSSSKITFKGILNALDGVASQEGRILFITTNHLKKLDPALIRPGRVDVKVLIAHATGSQIEKMFPRFYPELDNVDTDTPSASGNGLKTLSKRLVEAFEGANRKVSMACVQSLFILYKNDPTAAVENAGKHFDEYANENNSDLPDYYV